jgi:hypothetical protein
VLGIREYAARNAVSFQSIREDTVDRWLASSEEVSYTYVTPVTLMSCYACDRAAHLLHLYHAMAVGVR